MSVVYDSVSVLGRGDVLLSISTPFHHNSFRIGVDLGDGEHIVNLTDASDKFPDNMVAFLQGGPNLLSEAKKLVGFHFLRTTKNSVLHQFQVCRQPNKYSLKKAN